MSGAGRMGAADVSSEVQALRRCIGDVVALSTLSAVWAGTTRPAIAASLARVLHETVDADFVYVGLRATANDAACYSAYDSDAGGHYLRDAIRDGLASWLNTRDETSSTFGLVLPSVPHVLTPIGIAAEHGVIATLASRESFPSDIDRLLLNVAANQATLALLTGTARDEQRIADTLQRIGTSVAAELDPEKVVQAVTDQATALAGADFGAFVYNIADAAGGPYMLSTRSGAAPEALSRFPMPWITESSGPTFAGSGVVRLADVTADPRYGRNLPYDDMAAGHLPVRSYLAVPVMSRTGKVHGALVLGHKDVGVFTERHERLAVGVAASAALAMDNGYLYAEAQRANAAKDTFLATLSHELRTPLNAIVGWLYILRRPEAVPSADASRAWAAIDRNTTALTGLIADLLDVSRIASGKLHLSESDVDVTEVVRDSVRTIEPSFEDKHVALSVDMCPPPCYVRGDDARLRQVVVNLLSNAVKFTASGGQVEVRVTCDEAALTLVVADTGIGIHPDFLPNVFEQFRQGDAAATMGLGLGLAIVKNIVELHGGTVVAASDGTGRGSRFTVTLPRTASPHAEEK